MSPDRLNRLYSIFDVRRAAQRVLPQPIFDLIDGGAEDEWTLRRNESTFDERRLPAEDARRHAGARPLGHALRPHAEACR